MIRDGHLGFAEIFALLTIFLGTKVFLSLPQSLARDGHNAGWIILIISGLVALAGWKLLVFLIKPYQDLSLSEVIEKALGPYLGVPLNLGFTLTIILLIAVKLRHYSDTVAAAFLTETPLSVITALFLAGIVYLAYSGLEALGRTALFFAPWILAGIGAIIFGVFYWYEPSGLFPLLGPGPGPLLYHGLVRSSIAYEILVFALVIPMTQLTRKLPDTDRAVTLSLVVIFTILVMVQIAFAMVIPYPVSAEEAYPLLRMAQSIYLGRLIQHLEPIFLFIWVFAGVTNLGAGLYASSRHLASTLRLPVFRPLVFPLALISYALSFVFPTQPLAFRVDDSIGHYGIILALIISVLILVVARWRKIDPAPGAQTG